MIQRAMFGWTLGMAVACGGGEAVEEPPAQEDTTGNETAAAAENEPQIEGLMGTIPQFAIQSAIEPRMGKFLNCFAERMGDIEMLGGRVELTYRVALDGAVKWVYPRSSTVGDRATERCLTEVAARIRFRRPSGGEAEFSWPLEFDHPEDVRPPTAWTPDDVAEVLKENESTLSECGLRGAFTVTTYIDRGGAVMAVGASVDDPDAVSALDCIVEAVKTWQMPDPGSYPAKVSFEVHG